jgi:hypothetical protein
VEVEEYKKRLTFHSFMVNFNHLMDDDYYNEYNDQDATDCANGDFNQFEENQLALDNEGHDDMDAYRDDGEDDVLPEID